MQPKRKLVIGDVHGAYKALVQVLKRSNYNPQEDQLIFLGDYCDGWSETFQVIEYLIKLEEEAKFKPIFIKGNHDDWTAEFVIYARVSRDWMFNGGETTFDSYGKQIEGGMTDDELKKHQSFFQNLIPYYIDEENRGFVHGGFSAFEGLGHERGDYIYFWDRDLWKTAVLSHNNFPTGDIDERITKRISRCYKHKEIYLGHTTTMFWKAHEDTKEYNDPNQEKEGPITIPMNRCNIWNMDTGGGWSGKISIMDIDTKEYFQSDYCKELYPEEKGR